MLATGKSHLQRQVLIQVIWAKGLYTWGRWATSICFETGPPDRLSIGLRNHVIWPMELPNRCRYSAAGEWWQWILLLPNFQTPCRWIRPWTVLPCTKGSGPIPAWLGWARTWCSHVDIAQAEAQCSYVGSVRPVFSPTWLHWALVGFFVRDLIRCQLGQHCTLNQAHRQDLACRPIWHCSSSPWAKKVGCCWFKQSPFSCHWHLTEGLYSRNFKMLWLWQVCILN